MNRSDFTHDTMPKVSELLNRSNFTHEVSAHLAFCVDPGQAPGAVHGGAVTAGPPGRLPRGPAGELDLLQIRQSRPLAFHLQVGGPEPEDPGSVRVCMTSNSKEFRRSAVRSVNVNMVFNVQRNRVAY